MSSTQTKGVDPKKVVSKRKFKKLEAKLLKVEEGEVLVTTPSEDVKIIEQLLDLPEGFDNTFSMKFAQGTETCKNCGRHFNFLDLVKTGFGTHDKEFMKDVILGKHGYVLNPNKPMLHNCYNCGTISEAASHSYKCKHYGCSSSGDDGDDGSTSSGSYSSATYPD